jgi:hypothetical protein
MLLENILFELENLFTIILTKLKNKKSFQRLNINYKQFHTILCFNCFYLLLEINK